MSKWHWVRYGTEILRNVGVLPDGTIHNPNGYPEEIVRAAVADAEARRHERRSAAAKQAAETKAERRKLKVQIVAKRIVAAQAIGPRSSCYVCGRGLSDQQSIHRGIGSECWQDVLDQITKARRLDLTVSNGAST